MHKILKKISNISLSDIIFLSMGGFVLYVIIGIINTTFNPNSELNQKTKRDEFEKKSSQNDFDTIKSNNIISSIISDYQKNEIKPSKSKDKIELKKGLFFVELANGIMKPMSEINKLAREQNFKITTNKDSIRYLITAEFKSEKVGQYSNGEIGYKVQSIINAIDLKDKIIYNIINEIGTDPPQEITRRKYNDNTAAYGSRLWEKDILELLKRYNL